MEKKELVARRIVGMVEGGGGGAARALAAALLPALAALPPSLLTRDFYETFFNAIFKGFVALLYLSTSQLSLQTQLNATV